MDIRKFFPSNSQKSNEEFKSVLTEERENKGSPVKKRPKKTDLKKPPTMHISDEDSDGESPIPAHLRAEVAANSSRRRIISSDEDIDQYRPNLSKESRQNSKNTAQASKKKISSLERENVATSNKRPQKHQAVDLSSDDEVIKPHVKKSKTNVLKARESKQKSKHVSSDDDFVEVVPRQRRSKESKQIESSKKTSKTEDLVKVDSLSYFNNFNSKSATSSKVTEAKKTQNQSLKSDQVISTEKSSKANSTKISPNEQYHKPSKTSWKSTSDVSILRQPREINRELPWVDKYKPIEVKQLVGQQTPAAPMNKLLTWLKEWAKHNLGAGALEKKAKPSPFEAQRDGKAFKAVLLSGPPGVGKTTSAVMACKHLGLNYTEMNASDARNKKILDNRILELLGNTQMNQFYGDNKVGSTPKMVTHVLIMDEVDGMSGNQDRGGISELIQMIKSSRIPIICICNDRQSQKIRSLANNCFDLRFHRPNAQQVKGFLKTIAFREKVKVSDEALEKIIQSANQDIRQCIYSLQLISTGATNKDGLQKKDVSVNIFEAARGILSADTTFFQKIELFFSDYSIMPLFVQENYPHVQGPRMSSIEQLEALRKAADSIAFGDVVDKKIRTTGHWTLLTTQAMFSCVLPCQYLNGYMTAQISFPSWLGKNSTAQKRRRLMRQLSSHAHLKISGSNHSLVCDYLPVIRERMYRPLLKKESNGVKEVVELYVNYALTKDDTEAINELGVWSEKDDISKKIKPTVKSALTRALNKEHRLLPYAVIDMAKGRKKAIAAEVEIDEEGHIVERKLGSDDEDGEDNNSEDCDKTEEVVIQKPSTSKGSSTAKNRGGSSRKGGGTRGGRGGRGKSK